jgi:hypothetical protein
MKVAVLLSGHVREYKSIISFIRELSNYVTVDIYIHTWINRDMSNSTWREPEFNSTNNLDFEFLNKAFSPKCLIIEDQRNIDFFKFYNIANSDKSYVFSGAHYMIYGMYKAFEIFEKEKSMNQLHYDSIIRIRFDLCIQNCNELVKNLSILKTERSTIIMLAHNWASSLGAFFDGIILARPVDYSKIMSALPIYFEKNYGLINNKIRFIPELIISECIYRLNLKVNSGNFTANIIRKDLIIEQTFASSNSILSDLRSHSISLNLTIKSFESNFLDNYITRCWINKNGIFKVILFFILYSPILVIKYLKRLFK